MAKRTRREPEKTTVSFYGELLELAKRAAGDVGLTTFVHELVKVEAHRRLNMFPTLNGEPVLYAQDFFATLERIEGLAERTEELSAGQTKSLEQLRPLMDHNARIAENLAANVAVLMESMQSIIRLLIEDDAQLNAELNAINTRARARFDKLMQAAVPPARRVS
jgi:hypothetical protein